MTASVTQKNITLVTNRQSQTKPLPAKAAPRKKKRTRKQARIFTLADMMIALIAAALLSGGVLTAKNMVESSHIHSQIAQIEQFDSAITTFYDKYNGMPGDLLAVRAERFQLPYGDGTPGHSDGDGKISPCNLGWQWNLGCETALFWAQLAYSGLLPNTSDSFSSTSIFSHDTKLADSRLQSTSAMLSAAGVGVNAMDSYLPRSPLMEGVYIAVWNTDVAQSSPSPQLPYGNYFELSRISGVKSGKLMDDSHAITPVQARAIDEKMDDGSPRTGRIVVNGETDWPHDAWGTLAHPGDHGCVSADHTYNTYSFYSANLPLCHLAIALKCCDAEDDSN